MTETPRTARRAFLRRAAAIAAALPFAGLAAHPGRAQDDPRAEDGHAQNYVNNAPDADHPRYAEGQQCANCVFWQGEDAEWGGCQHPEFRNVQVSRNGWCSAYAPRA